MSGRAPVFSGRVKCKVQDARCRILPGVRGRGEPFRAGKGQKPADGALEFGFSPDYEYGTDTDPTVPNLSRSGSLALANAGDELVLKDGSGTIVDSVVYEGGNPSDTGWFGPTISPYSGDTVGIERFAQGEADVEGFGIEGQILYRKLDQTTGLPVPDTDMAEDWAQATDDDINGKKVMYPGWDLERYFFTDAFSETATLTHSTA
jgi:hypothetical protein